MIHDQQAPKRRYQPDTDSQGDNQSTPKRPKNDNNGSHAYPSGSMGPESSSIASSSMDPSSSSTSDFKWSTSRKKSVVYLDGYEVELSDEDENEPSNYTFIDLTADEELARKLQEEEIQSLSSTSETALQRAAREAADAEFARKLARQEDEAARAFLRAQDDADVMVTRIANVDGEQNLQQKAARMLTMQDSDVFITGISSLRGQQTFPRNAARLPNKADEDVVVTGVSFPRNQQSVINGSGTAGSLPFDRSKVWGSTRRTASMGSMDVKPAIPFVPPRIGAHPFVSSSPQNAIQQGVAGTPQARAGNRYAPSPHTPLRATPSLGNSILRTESVPNLSPYNAIRAWAPPLHLQIGQNNLPSESSSQQSVRQVNEDIARYNLSSPTSSQSSSSFPFPHPPIGMLGGLQLFEGQNVDELLDGPMLTEAESEEALRDLLTNVQHNNGDVTPKHLRIQTPKELKVELMEHQKIGVEWMLKMEQGKNHGGILADDMGLGKTIQSIATILLNPPPKEERKARTTLVVAPVSLLRQWELEIRRKVVGGTLKVLLYHGPKRPKKVEALSKFDVILTSYSIVSAEWPNKKRKKKKNKKGKEAEGEADKDFDVNIEDESPDEMMKRAGPLFFMTYHRIILDEAHTIKNHAIQTSISACALEAKHRWCLTGTPFQNNLLELYSLLRFLQISPYNDKNRFASHITSQFKRGRHMTVLKRVQAILAACCFRRTKKAILDGRPIIDLPPKTVQWFQDPFTDDEQKFYRALETESALQFNKYLKQDTVMKNYANILVLLLKLRQAACHPGLVTVKVDPNEERMLLYDGQSSSSSKPSKTTRLLTSMKKEVVRRLLEEDSGLRGECAICMDVVADGVLLVECGHSFCRECLDSYYKTVEHDPLCPTCRGTLDIDETLPVAVFLAHHRPSKAAPEGKGKEPATDTTEQQSTEVDEYGFPITSAPQDVWVSSTKINRMMEILEERRTNAPKDKIIIFSHFVKMLDMIETILLVRGFQFVRYDGQMTPDERAAAVEDLERDPDLNIILVSKKCGSLGLNLVCCNIVILLDIWWNPAVDNQAIDRVHRLGQRKEVKVYRLLIANTIEDRILELQKMKQKLCDASLGEGDPAEGGSFNARLGVEDLIYLFRVNQDEELPEAFS